jgi:hypothetical protein
MAGGTSTLPRQFHRAILLLLRPAESAARRLIIAAARGVVVELPPLRPYEPQPVDPELMLLRLGIPVTMPPDDFARFAAAKRAAALRATRPRTMSLPLLDPLNNPFRIRRRYVPAHAAPRILSLDDDAPYHRLPPPPSPDDPINATRIGLRLQALSRVLDDLPAQAQRFARWKARNDAGWARVKEDHTAPRPKRVVPLRMGRPPGGRLWRYDPTARRKKSTRDIDEILAHCHSLALYALDPPRRDTS